ncbi:MAG TPA: hypothetical protein VII97_05435 [Anaerolineales bacterium]
MNRVRNINAARGYLVDGLEDGFAQGRIAALYGLKECTKDGF